MALRYLPAKDHTSHQPRIFLKEHFHLSDNRLFFLGAFSVAEA